MDLFNSIFDKFLPHSLIITHLLLLNFLIFHMIVLYIYHHDLMINHLQNSHNSIH